MNNRFIINSEHNISVLEEPTDHIINAINALVNTYKKIGNDSFENIDLKNIDILSKDIGNMIFLNKNKPVFVDKNSSKIIQKWECYVVDVGDHTFWARIVPIKGEGVEQEVEIYKSEVLSDEYQLIEKGAIFYWSIGYKKTRSGTIQKDSMIRFRRKLNWDDSDFQKASLNARKLKDFFQNKYSRK
jgi:hypothetical protein